MQTIRQTLAHHLKQSLYYSIISLSLANTAAHAAIAGEIVSGNPAPQVVEQPPAPTAQPSTQNQPPGQAPLFDDNGQPINNYTNTPTLDANGNPTAAYNAPAQQQGRIATPEEIEAFNDLQMSPSDQKLKTALKQRLNISVSGPVQMTVANGNVTLTGIIGSNDEYSAMIGNAISTPGIGKLNYSGLKLGNGNRPTQVATAIGFTQGRIILRKIFGSSVTLVNQLPIQITAQYNVQFIGSMIYLDGVVPSVYARTESIVIAQRAVLQFAPNTRVLSRLNIRSVTVNE